MKKVYGRFYSIIYKFVNIINDISRIDDGYLIYINIYIVI